MHIDPFILAAQIVNFLILVYLLKRFLYDKIVDAMNLREAGIARQLSETDRLKAEAQMALAACEEQKCSINGQAGEMLNQARLAAEKEKDRLMGQMREEVSRTQKRWIETLDREKAAFLEGLRNRAGAYVFETIRQVLFDLADEELERKIVQTFIRRMASLEPDEKRLLEKALDTPEPVIRIRTAFELSRQLKLPIEEALKPFLGPDSSIIYELNGHTGAGIEMMAHGYKLCWSIDDYLTSLQDKFLQILKEEAGALDAQEETLS
jgi:F-type H+-transporting ATPase subunit b